MTREQEYFLSLVNSHLNSTQPKAPIDIDFSELFKVCELQNMTAIAAVELKKLPADMKPDKVQFSPFNQVLGLTVQNFEYKLEGINILKETLNQNKIKHLFLKGAAIRELYPVPEIRTSGDTDVVVDKADFDKTTELLLNNGFNLIKESDDENVLTYNNEQYELKNRIEHINNACKLYFNDTFDISKCYKTDEYTYVLNPLEHLIYITYHALKHIKGGGIGVRQLADIDILFRKCSVDIVQYFECCQSLGFENSAKVLVYLTKQYFDTPIELDYEINQELKNSLTEIILNGGPFGFSNNKGVTRLYNTIAKGGKSDKNNVTKAILSLFIVDKRLLYNSYKFADKHHILLPAAYFARLFDAVFRRGGQNIKNIRAILTEQDFAESVGIMLSELEENE